LEQVDTKQDISGRWAREGFSCGTWIDPPGQVWRDFVHETDEKVFVLEGQLELTVSEVTRTLSPGDEAFIPARANHTVRNIGGTTAKWLYGYRSGETPCRLMFSPVGIAPQPYAVTLRTTFGSAPRAGSNTKLQAPHKKKLMLCVISREDLPRLAAWAVGYHQ
jgi:uncharacterized cupin superfamily protein